MADVAHHFTYVRGNDERETILRLMVNRLVSFDGKAPHGSWAYAWDGAVGKGAFKISFNCNPKRNPRDHVFVQVGETNVYRHWEHQVQWTAFIIESKPIFMIATDVC